MWKHESSCKGILVKAIMLMDMPVARIDLEVGCKTPQKWTFWTHKVDFLNLTSLNSRTKTPLLAHFLATCGHFGRFGGEVHHSHHFTPPAYLKTVMQLHQGHNTAISQENISDQYGLFKAWFWRKSVILQFLVNPFCYFKYKLMISTRVIS